MTSSRVYVTPGWHDAALPRVVLGADQPLPPLACKIDDGDDTIKIVCMSRTRQKGDKRMTERTANDIGAITRVPCNTNSANVCLVRVSMRSLLCACLHGASQLGWGGEALEYVRAATTADDMGGHRCVRALLNGMLRAGIPALLSVGMSTFDRTREMYEGMYDKWAAGSVLFLVDDDDNVVAVAVPMGQLTFVPPGDEGFLPRELRDLGRNDRDESMSCLEGWVELLCVASYDDFAKHKWFKNDDPDYNWDLNRFGPKPGYKDIRFESSSRILPKSGGTPIVALFPETTLAALGKYVTDFAGNLRAMVGVPLKRKRLPAKLGRPPKELAALMQQMRITCEASMYFVWRRAVLLRAVLDKSDELGHANRTLMSVLPASMWSYARAAVLPAVAVEPVREFLVSDLVEDLGVGTAEIQEAVRCVKPAKAKISPFARRRPS